MNQYEWLRFVAKSSQTLWIEHVNVRHLGFSKSIIVDCWLKCTFCEKGVLWAHNIPYFSDSTCFHLALLWRPIPVFHLLVEIAISVVSKVHVMLEH